MASEEAAAGPSLQRQAFLREAFAGPRPLPEARIAAEHKQTAGPAGFGLIELAGLEEEEMAAAAEKAAPEETAAVEAVGQPAPAVEDSRNLVLLNYP